MSELQDVVSISLDKIKPLSYTLTLDVSSMTIQDSNTTPVYGDEIYEFSVLKETNTLELNADELRIQSLTLLNQDPVAYAPTWSEDTVNNVLTITFPNSLPLSDSLKLHIIYEFNFSQSLSGLYTSKYRDSNKTPKRMVATQFEACSARKAIPCVDQPNAKAKFQISLIHPKGETALSNMPVESISVVESSPSLIKTTFMVSPLMSSYLVAIVVGEFDVVSGSCYGGKLPVNVYTFPGQGPHSHFALQKCIDAIEYITKFTGIPIPVPKMDLCCVADFDPGADRKSVV